MLFEFCSEISEYQRRKLTIILMSQYSHLRSKETSLIYSIEKVLAQSGIVEEVSIAI